MSSPLEVRLQGLIARVVQVCMRRRAGVIAVYLFGAAMAGWYTVQNVSINTDTTDMLSAELPWRIAYEDYKDAFPFFVDTLLVVVDAATPDLADEAARKLSSTLARDPEHFVDVFNPAALPFIRAQQFLYLDTAALEDLIDELSGGQALLGRLAADPGLIGLFGVLTEVARADEDRPPARLADLLGEIDATIAHFLAGERTPMSWARMLGGEAIELPQQVVFTAQPRLDYGNVLPATEAIGALRAQVAELGYDEHPDVRVRLTGAAALGYDELRSVVRGAERAATLALVLVAACLIIGLRSLSLVFATLLALVVGLVLTASFATLAVGTLNMISVAFAVLYVGLGVDFAIHLCLRYRELAGGRLQEVAMIAAARHVGVSLALCALTTAVAFFAFIPTSYRGVAELGLISGVGIVIGLIVSLTLLPALLRVLPAPRPPRRSGSARLLQAAGATRNRHILILAAVCAIAALFTLPHASFDDNPLHLNDPFAESVTTLQDLDDDASMDFIAAIAPDQSAAATLDDRLTTLPTVTEVISVDDLVPQDQDEKLALIDDLRFTLGDVLEPAAATPLSPAVAGPALADLEQALAGVPSGHALAATFTDLGATVRRLRAMLDGLPTAAAHEQLVALEYMLMHHFPDQLARLRRGLEAERITQDLLPEPLLRRWVTDEGRYRLEIRPRDANGSSQALARFVEEVRGVLGTSVTGTPVINIEAGRAVTKAFYEAFAAAGVFITALLFCLLRRLREVAVVLAPLLLAGLLTTAISIALGIPFNFANIIALPLLLGIGVDSALHILHRYKTTGQDDAPLLATSSARAVLFSALTSAASFGNLAVSDHAGTASMGIMLTIGLTMTLLCTLVVLPALLRRFVEISGALTAVSRAVPQRQPPA